MNKIYYTVQKFGESFYLFFVESAYKMHMWYEKETNQKKLVTTFENEVKARGLYPMFLPPSKYSYVLWHFSVLRRIETIHKVWQ